jgi:hypothetical protein
MDGAAFVLVYARVHACSACHTQLYIRRRGRGTVSWKTESRARDPKRGLVQSIGCGQHSQLPGRTTVALFQYFSVLLGLAERLRRDACRSSKVEGSSIACDIVNCHPVRRDLNGPVSMKIGISQFMTIRFSAMRCSSMRRRTGERVQVVSCGGRWGRRGGQAMQAQVQA